MPVEAVARLVEEARAASFREVVLTGGEPLIHAHRDALLAELKKLRKRIAPVKLVLRTNLTLPLDTQTLREIADAVDRIAVSVDGSEETHNQRRGADTYAATVRNLEAYIEASGELRVSGTKAGESSLACSMCAADIRSDPGDAVRALAARLGIRPPNFRPLLPLGRAAGWNEPPTSEALRAHAEPMELIQDGFQPVASCGLGQNLYVEPSGDSFPCYAYHLPHAYLGNVIDLGLESVLQSAAFGNLAKHDVHTNPKCRNCNVRYLSGGACRAWGGESTQYDLDAFPPDCEGLQQRARMLLAAALQYLGICEFSETRLCSRR